jgi:hypothetical protein
LLSDSTQAFETVNHLLSVVPEDRQFELAEVLVDFTQKNDVLLPFIKQVVSIEVAQTSLKYETITNNRNRARICFVP